MKSMHIACLIKSFESIINIVNKVPSLVILIASIVFNNSFGVENHIYWLSEWNMRSEENNDLKTTFISQVSAFDVVMNLATPFLISNPYWSFQTYQRYLSGQPSVIYAILNLVAPLLASNPCDSSQKYQKPIFHLYLSRPLSF